MSARIVLDANILIRAIFGEKVYNLLRKYEGHAEFYTPDFCIQEARAKIPEIAAGNFPSLPNCSWIL